MHALKICTLHTALWHYFIFKYQEPWIIRIIGASQGLAISLGASATVKMLICPNAIFSAYGNVNMQITN